MLNINDYYKFDQVSNLPGEFNDHLLMVTDDTNFNKIYKSTLEDIVERKNQILRKQIKGKLKRNMDGVIGGAAFAVAVAGANIVTPVALIVTPFWVARKGIKYIGSKPLMPCISTDRARELYRFSGTAEKHNIYKRHPLLTGGESSDKHLYIPIEEYDEWIAQEKVNAFMTLAGGLHAKSMSLIAAKRTKTLGFINWKVDTQMEGLASLFGIEAKWSNKTLLEKKVVKTWDLPNAKRHIPSSVSNWAESEEQCFKQLKNRMELSDTSLTEKCTITISTEKNRSLDLHAFSLTNKLNSVFNTSRLVNSEWVFELEYFSKAELDGVKLYEE